MTTLPQTTSIQLPRPVGSAPLAAPAMPSGGPMQPAGLTGADVWRVIRANIWLILISLFVALVAGFFANWLLSVYYPRFTATGYVQIQPGQPIDPQGTLRGNTYYQDNTTLVVEQRSQAAMLRTDGLFSQVLANKTEIRNTDWFNEFKKADGTSVDIARAKADLFKKFSATPIPDSKLIAVSFTYSQPKDCRTVVLDIVSQHLENERKRNLDKIVSQQAVLNQLLSRYSARIRELKNDTTVKAATLQVDGYGRPGGLSQKETELSQRITEKLKSETEAEQAKTALSSAEQTLQQGGTPPAVDMMVSRDPSVMRLKQQVDDYDIQLSAMQNQGPEARTFRQLQAYRDATQQKLDEVRAEERTIQTVAYLDNLKSAVSATESALETSNKQIEKLRSDLSDMTQTLSDYLTKKDEESGYQELSKRVRDQLDVLQTNLQAQEMNTIAMVSPPETPDTPSFPNLPVTLAVFGAIGLGLSLGISFLREVMDTSVRSPRDIARVGNMTLLGMIPHEDDDPQAAGVPLPTVIYGAPTSMLAEQFRQVRTRLQHAASLDTTRSLLITSPGPEDGKSTVACNLAAGLALNGRRILLVDANFRRPELHKIFALENNAGFANVLSSIDNFEASVRQTKVPNLDVLPTGAKPANATELLESQLLIDFIERALEEYDHVIFDTGPVLFVSETVALAPRVDGVVTVVRARSNSRGLLTRMRDALRQLKAEHLGVVLNGVRSTGGGYYGRNIKTYYEYQNGHAG